MLAKAFECPMHNILNVMVWFIFMMKTNLSGLQKLNLFWLKPREKYGIFILEILLKKENVVGTIKEIFSFFNI